MSDDRVRALVEAVAAELGLREEQEVPELPEGERQERTWQLFDLQPLGPYEREMSARLIEAIDPIRRKVQGQGYAYAINPKLSPILTLVWVGEPSERLEALASKLAVIAQSIQDNLWETYDYYRVRAVLEADTRSIDEEHRAEIDAIYEHYSRRPPREVHFNPESDSFIVKVTALNVGWYIGKQGAVIKPLEEKVGKKIKVVGV